MVLIFKALYILNTSGSIFNEKFDQSMIIFLTISYADSDVLLKDFGSYYEYLDTWVDNTIYSVNI